jgi:hypothetical protein
MLLQPRPVERVCWVIRGLWYEDCLAIDCGLQTSRSVAASFIISFSGHLLLHHVYSFASVELIVDVVSHF